MKILHLIHRFYPFHGGSENYFYEISRRLARDGDEVTVYTTDAWDLEHLWKSGYKRIEEPQETVEGIHIRRFPVTNAVVGKKIIRTFAKTVPTLAAKCYWSPTSPLLPDLWRESRKGRSDYDIVHTCPYPMDVLHYTGRCIARRSSAPHIITPCIHPGEGGGDIIDSYTRPHQIRMLKEADLVLALTRLERELLLSLGVKERKVQVLGHAVDPVEIEGGNGAGLRKKLGLDEKAVLIGHIGGLSIAKGTHDVCRAVLKLAGEGLDIHAALQGPPLSEFTKFLDGLDESAGRHIHNMGYVDNLKRNDLLDAMDICALPSKTDSFGTVLLEAWFYDKPVITCPLGGPKELVQHEENGLHVLYGNVDALSDAIRRLAADAELCGKLGRTGHTRAEEAGFFSWEGIYQNLRSFYETLV
jgi:glycosyltransferase involved in cell wall biosynthesis